MGEINFALHKPDARNGRNIFRVTQGGFPHLANFQGWKRLIPAGSAVEKAIGGSSKPGSKSIAACYNSQNRPAVSEENHTL